MTDAQVTRTRRRVTRRTQDSLPLDVRVRLYCRERGLPEPRAELKFHPTRKWALDFAWPEHRVALEVHGATYRTDADGRPAPGRHTRGAGFDEDREKMGRAQMAGWVVLECSHEMLFRRRGLWVWDCLRQLILGEET